MIIKMTLVINRSSSRCEYIAKVILYEETSPLNLFQIKLIAVDQVGSLDKERTQYLGP